MGGESACLVCRARSFQPRYQRFGPLAQCNGCGFVTADVEFADADVRRLYDQRYFSGGEYDDYLRDRPAIQRNLTQRLENVLEYKRGGFLVEIGCAYGFFLELARPHFRVLGYDVADHAVEYCGTSSASRRRRSTFWRTKR